MDNKKLLWFYPASFFIILLILVYGCSFPRIIFLDDKLSPEEHIALGVAYEQKGQLEYAIKEYESASGKTPAAYFYLGNAYFQKNDLETAEKYYRKTIKHNPDHADAHNNLAWLYYIKRQNLAEAESLANRAIELTPDKKAVYLDTLEKIRGLR
jgi:tetratricopeptide (TPR) repeat protein